MPREALPKKSGNLRNKRGEAKDKEDTREREITRLEARRILLDNSVFFLAYRLKNFSLAPTGG